MGGSRGAGRATASAITRKARPVGHARLRSCERARDRGCLSPERERELGGWSRVQREERRQPSNGGARRSRDDEPRRRLPPAHHRRLLGSRHGRRRRRGDARIGGPGSGGSGLSGRLRRSGHDGRRRRRRGAGGRGSLGRRRNRPGRRRGPAAGDRCEGRRRRCRRRGCRLRRRGRLGSGSCRGRRRQGCREEREWIEIPLVVRGVADAEVHVRHRELRGATRPDAPDDGSFGDGGVACDRDRAEVREGHGETAVGLNRDRLAARRDGAGEGDDAGCRREDGRAAVGADRDAAMLPRRVRMRRVEGERLEHGPLNGPCPRGRRGHEDQEQEHDRSQPPHAHHRLCCPK